MSEGVSAQFWNIIENKTLTKLKGSGVTTWISNEH